MLEPGSTEVKIPVDAKMPTSQDTVVDLRVPVDRIHVHGSLKGLKTTSKEVAEAVRERWLKEREDILRLPSQEDGLRMDRIHAFRERIGVPKKEIRILSPEDYVKARKISGDVKNDSESLSLGRHLPDQDIIIVKRDPDLESMNGTELIESFVIHEITHSANGNDSSRVDVKLTNRRRKLMGLIGKNVDEVSVSDSNARMGFIVRRDEGKLEGYFLEEGYAELERGIYVAQELGKPEGFGEGIGKGISHHLDKYMWLSKAGLTVSDGSMPAIILGLLIDRDPELLPALRESHRSVEGLREVARRIDAISPGLYQELRKFNIKSEGANVRSAHMFKKVESLMQGESSSSSPDVSK